MYLVTNANGDVELEIDSDNPAEIQKAVDGAFSKHTPVYTVSDPTIDAMERAPEARLPNPVDRSPAHAMRISGLPWDEKRGVGITLAQVEARYPLTKDGLAAAHADLLKYFPHTEKEFGADQWNTPARMARFLLKSNTKTSKAVEGVGVTVPPSYAVGINVMPFALGAMMSDTPAEEQRKAYYKDPKNRKRPVDFRRLPFVAPRIDDPSKTRQMEWTEKRPHGLCAGSSDACRRTCLVFTGQNGAVAYNDISKLMTERAMFFEPLAFGRMLIEAIEKHYTACKRSGLKPFVRLNVYSDIPWELFFPDMLDHFEAKYGHDIHRGGLWFYDYTKVPGRGPKPRPNYDLTFSYSGGNLNAVREALAGNMRAAVVFLRAVASGSKESLFEVTAGKTIERLSAMTKAAAVAKFREKHPGLRAAPTVEKLRGPTYKPAEPLTDLVFEGAPVIDGDSYDMRPLDPGNVVVGLRFKVPRRIEVEGKSRKEAAVERAGSFVLAPPKHDEKFLVEAKRLDGNWFYTQVTPSQTHVNLAAQLNDAAAAE